MSVNALQRPSEAQARAARLLASVGTWGALLTVTILAASVLLRLATTFDASGEAVSMLPASLETAIRLAHRVSAMAVALLAVLAVMAAAALRPASVERSITVAVILALTIFLAAIGRYTTGYRMPWVTVGNVVCGIALACAFLWLRERAAAVENPATPRAAAFATLALGALLAQAALGAAASAAALHGLPGPGAMHLWMGGLFIVLTLVAAWPHRNAPTRVLALAIVLLACLQLELGLVLAGAGHARSVAAAWSHAMLACVLAVGLVRLAARRPSPPPP